MELLVIIGIALLVGAVVLYRKLGQGGDTSLSTGNPSANDERTDGRSP